RRREAAPPKSPWLHKGKIHRGRSRYPVVDGIIEHAQITPIPKVVAARDDLREAIDARPVLHGIVLPVGFSPGTAERIAEAKREDVVSGANPIRGIVE